MQQIEVKVIRIQPLQLSGEEALCVLQGLHLPGRQLGGQVIALPGHVRQDAAQDALALLLMIKIGGVDVIDPRLQRPAEHGGDSVLLYASRIVRGKAHAAEAQQGDPGIQRRPSTVFHKNSSRSS